MTFTWHLHFTSKRLSMSFFESLALTFQRTMKQHGIGTVYVYTDGAVRCTDLNADSGAVEGLMWFLVEQHQAQTVIDGKKSPMTIFISERMDEHAEGQTR